MCRRETPNEVALRFGLWATRAALPVEHVKDVSNRRAQTNKDAATNRSGPAEATRAVNDDVGASPGLGNDVINERIDRRKRRQHAAVRNGQAQHTHTASARFVDERGNLQAREFVIFQQADLNSHLVLLHQFIQVAAEITFPSSARIRGIRVLAWCEGQSHLPGQAVHDPVDAYGMAEGSLDRHVARLKDRATEARRQTYESLSMSPNTSFLTFWCGKHANSSSKSFVIGPLKPGPLPAQVLDRGDARIWRHRLPELTVRAAGVLE